MAKTILLYSGMVNAHLPKGMTSRTIAAVVLAALLGGWNSATAQDEPAWRENPIGSRFAVAVGVYWPRIDTKVRVDGTGGQIGTGIDFESTLGMDDNDLLPTVLAYYRFNEKHRIYFQYFTLERDGAAVSDFAIRFGDVVFPANLPLSSFFNMDVYSLGYAYSLIHDKNKELTFSFGLQLQDIEIGIRGNLGGVLENEVDVLAPLPTFGGAFDYAISDKWIFNSLLGIFAIEIEFDDESKFAGEIIQASLGVTHKTFKNVGFALRYNYFRIDVDVDDSAWAGVLKYEYHGPVLAVAAYF